MDTLRKTKGKFARSVLLVAMALLCAFSVSGEARAYNYYDGTNTNFSTYGSAATNDSTLDSGAAEISTDYKVAVLVIRGTNRTGKTTIDESYVKNYGASKTTPYQWKYRNANKIMSNYDHSKSVCNTIPTGWAKNDNVHLGSNGVAYYTCGTCGNPLAYIVDMVEYGYYDKDGKVNLTGFTGYLHCPKCADPKKTGDMYVVSGETQVGKVVGSYIENQPASAYWQGVYVYNDIKNKLGKYVITTDPGYIGNENNVKNWIEWYKYLSDTVFKSGSYSTYSGSDVTGTFQIRAILVSVMILQSKSWSIMKLPQKIKVGMI